MMNCPDNYDQFVLHEERLARLERESTCPCCVECNEKMEEGEWAYYIDGDWICEECMSTYLRKVYAE